MSIVQNLAASCICSAFMAACAQEVPVRSPQPDGPRTHAPITTPAAPSAPAQGSVRVIVIFQQASLCASDTVLQALQAQTQSQQVRFLFALSVNSCVFQINTSPAHPDNTLLQRLRAMQGVRSADLDEIAHAH